MDRPIERRRHPRFAVEIPIRVSGTTPLDSLFLEETTTINVSTSGLLFPSQYPVLPHRTLDIELRPQTVPEDRVRPIFDVVGIVVRVEEIPQLEKARSVAIQFVEPPRYRAA